MTMRAVTLLAAALTLLASAGCASSSSDGGGEGETSSTFLAFSSSFTSYKTWEKFPVDAPITDDVHTSGPRTEYLNERPAKGSRAFPVGTIIVKELEVGPEADRKVFAMVKRGGDYNASGARGWEWFELKNGEAGAVTILWRGLGPPAGEKYGGDASGGCNGCHAAQRDNDSVTSSRLSLAKL